MTKLNELEVSIFGSHVGEWMIVDSCRRPSNKEPVALTYLKNIGVDITLDVELIVITHWHDDHIQGLSSLLWPGQAGVFSCAGVLFLSGIVLFSFSLYAISLLGLNVALITPFGGTAFILGWLLMAVGVWKAGG